MKASTKNKKTSIRDILKLFYVFVPLGLLLSYFYFTDEYSNKMLKERGTDTECVVIAFREGKSGVRGPKKGYYNKCQYIIDDSIHYCYVFTTIKPLPFYTKILVRYYQKKDGTIKIDFPEAYKYKEYGFNDYGY